MNPNSEQQAVIDPSSWTGATSLISGPGSGKTATLIARYKAMIESGISKKDILALTFTKEAASEMERRGGSGNFRTFHSYGFSILKAEKGDQKIEPELRNRLLFRLHKKYGLEYKAIASFISSCRHKNVSPEIAIEEYGYALGQAYGEYERTRLAAGWIDFDCMIVDAVHLLENPEVRARHQWKYVMADEAQDTDDVQFRMLQLITERYGNVLVVGDPGQSIYMFRGAKPENLIDFSKWFPICKTLYLGKNYRSSHIITSFVRENYPIVTPLKEKLLPARAEIGGPIEYKMFVNQFDEAEDTVVRANTDPLNSAILARTNRGLSAVEKFCIENSVPYTLLGKSGFFRQSEIIRTIEKLKPYGNLSLDMAMGMILPDLEKHYRAEDATPEDNFALENIRTLREIGKKFPDTRTFCVFANKAAHARKTKKGITLSTIHQAKGQEFRNVFIIDARADVIPHVKGCPEEERRIFFVAISRAKDRLRISFCGTPSPYLRRYLPEDVLLQLTENAHKVEKLQTQFSLL